MLYFFLLGDADISLAVPITNSLTFIFTMFSGMILGEDLMGRVSQNMLGLALVTVGLSLCIYSKTYEEETVTI